MEKAATEEDNRLSMQAARLFLSYLPTVNQKQRELAIETSKLVSESVRLDARWSVEDAVLAMKAALLQPTVYNDKSADLVYLLFGRKVRNVVAELWGHDPASYSDHAALVELAEQVVRFQNFISGRSLMDGADVESRLGIINSLPNKRLPTSLLQGAFTRAAKAMEIISKGDGDAVA
jgi:hypothetical protein